MLIGMMMRKPKILRKDEIIYGTKDACYSTMVFDEVVNESRRVADHTSLSLSMSQGFVGIQFQSPIGSQVRSLGRLLLGSL